MGLLRRWKCGACQQARSPTTSGARPRPLEREKRSAPEAERARATARRRRATADAPAATTTESAEGDQSHEAPRAKVAAPHARAVEAAPSVRRRNAPTSPSGGRSGAARGRSRSRGGGRAGSRRGAVRRRRAVEPYSTVDIEEETRRSHPWLLPLRAHSRATRPSRNRRYRRAVRHPRRASAPASITPGAPPAYLGECGAYASASIASATPGGANSPRAAMSASPGRAAWWGGGAGSSVGGGGGGEESVRLPRRGRRRKQARRGGSGSDRRKRLQDVGGDARWPQRRRPAHAPRSPRGPRGGLAEAAERERVIASTSFITVSRARADPEAAGHRDRRLRVKNMGLMVTINQRLDSIRSS